MDAPASLTPLLKLSFVLFYVLLAAFVGAFADALPKGRVMFIANIIKVFGCALMFVGMLAAQLWPRKPVPAPIEVAQTARH